MDGAAFDRLSRAVATSSSRRRLLGLLSGLPLVGLVRGHDVAAAPPGRKSHRHHAQHQPRHAKTQRRKDEHDNAHGEACIPTGQRCPSGKPRGKHHKKLSCEQCCQGSFVTEASGKKTCGCQPNGGTCTSATASSCCSGFCDGSTCQAAPCSAAIPCPQCQSCNSATGRCEAVADGATCDDGDACTETDTCQGGVCVGTNPVVCAPIDQCHLAGVCNPVTGICSDPIKANGTACDDGDPCTTGDTCQGGICTPGTPVLCASGQHCVGGTCVCDGTSCAGCCNGTTCVPVGMQTNSQCGTGGGTCAACSGATPVCVSGTCQPCSMVNPCPECQTCSGGQCVANTGQNRACCGDVNSGTWCQNGSCVTPGGSFADCQGRCDATIAICGQNVTCPSCGTCGTICPSGGSGSCTGGSGAGQYCVNGIAAVFCTTCEAPRACCGGTCFNTCA